MKLGYSSLSLYEQYLRLQTATALGEVYMATLLDRSSILLISTTIASSKIGPDRDLVLFLYQIQTTI